MTGMCVCVCACVRACVRACVCVRVYCMCRMHHTVYNISCHIIDIEHCANVNL